jgi:hypothetical protein
MHLNKRKRELLLFLVFPKFIVKNIAEGEKI